MEEKKIRNMEEFAAAAGISRPTVSKYFNDPDSVRKATRLRIEEALRKYDFRPNIFAMNQNRRMTKNVGILVPYLSDPTFAEIARSIERRCIAAGFRPTLFSSHGEQALESEALDSLRSLRPAGVLLAPLGRLSDIDDLDRFCQDVPTILLDRNIDGIGEAFIGSDNVSFVSQSVAYLTRTGEPPCFFEMKNPSNPNAHRRRQVYLDTMKRLGLEPMLVSVDGEGWALEEIGYRGAMRLIDEKALPTDTVLCSNDRLAIGFIAACYERGLRVGRGSGCALRVAGHDDHPFSQFTSPSLTTVGHEYDVVANRGVERLLELIESGGRFDRRTEELLPARLVLRRSA